MHAAVVNVLGQPPQYQEFPEPVAGAGEVAIRVRAVGLHPVVKAISSGEHYSAGGEVPAVPGIDGVGTLEDGRRVYFGGVRRPWGTMAERAVVASNMCIPLPDELDDAQAAAIANPAMSAWVSLKSRAEVTAGETVLILGATGVAGQLAIQVARHLGAKRVIGAGRNLDAIADAGADAIIALGQPEDAVRKAFAAEAAKGIDVVIDYLWGRPTELLLEALASRSRSAATHRTRLVEVGESAGKSVNLPGAVLRSVDLTLKGSGFGSASIKDIVAAIPAVFSMAAAQTLKVAFKVLPLEGVEAAWGKEEKGHRLVFTID
jgi:NADPH:quinone reductase-like Zn-dependent oxidoreductase